MNMTRFSCMSNANQKPNTSPGHRHHISIDTYKDVTQTTVLGHRGPKIQTVMEVVKSEVGRSKRALKSNGLSKVQHAAQRNHEAALLHYLRAGHSPDDVKGTGSSPLSIAVTAGYIGIVKILCEAGADCKASTTPENETPLHLAIKHGRLDIMDVLLSYGSDLDAQTSTTGETPLHYAATIGSLAGVVTLLKSGANYETTNRNGQSPAEVAFQGRHVHVAVAIISAARGNRKLTKEKEMLLKYVEKSQNRFSMNNELIADIFEAGCDPDSTVLIEAIKRNDLSLAEMFLDKGADPNRPTTAGIRPIFAALSCSSAQIVQLLVKHGADVTLRDTEGLNVLQAAFESPSVHEKDAIAGIFEALLVGGADPTVLYPDGRTLLHRAVESEYGLAKVAQLLLQHGIHVNERDNGANTPLHLATHSRSCTELLLKNGAGSGLVNSDGLTPLLFAVTNNTSDTEPELESLVKVSNLRTLDTQQKSALHLAAQNGLEKAVRALLRCRANTTLIDANNMTPLLLAAIHHRWSVVAILATQPGTNARDKEGMTALHHAVMSIPKGPAQWKDIAFAVRKFCERGISRTMRDRFGATPLIQAVKTLPEEGFPVIQVLLSDTGAGRSNCVAHEDHKKRSALYFAATLGKPTFVRALLMNGATFALEEWRLGKKAPIQPTSAENKQTLKLLAGHEWLRRMGLLKRHTGGDDSEVCALAEILPVSDLKDMLAMGLDPNSPPVPPRTGGRFTGPLLWIILNQTILQPTPPTEYLFAIFKLLLSSGADPNVTHVSNLEPPSPKRKSFQALEAKGSSPSLQGRKSQFLSFYHTLSFLLEQHPTIDIDIITLFLSKGANLTTASSFYDGRYPLHSAVKGNRLDVVDEFLGRRADINAVDHKQRTPLFIAAGKGFWELVDILLKCGAKVDVRDADDNTPLHAACAGGSARIVNALLRKGAKPSVKNQKGRVPSDCIPESLLEQEREKIAAMLPKPEPITPDQDRLHLEKKPSGVLKERQRSFRDLTKPGNQKPKEAPSSTSSSSQKPHTEPQQWPGPQPIQPLQWSLRSSVPKPQPPSQRPQVEKRQSAQHLPSQKPSQKQPRRWSLLSPRPSLIATYRNSSAPTPVPSDNRVSPSASPSPEPQSVKLQLSKKMTKKSAPTTTRAPSPKSEPIQEDKVKVKETKPTAGKGIKQPRIDSGLGGIVNTDKPLPPLNRGNTTLSKLSRESEGSDEDTTLVEGQSELSEWLQVSKMLDRL